MIYVLALVAIPTVVMAADHCMFLGKQYAIDEQFHPSPCQVCLCVAPSVACTTFDCPPVMCVDSVQKKGECCRTCPNGHNCQHGGHVITHGEVYNLGNGTQCQCIINSYQHSPNAQGTFTDALGQSFLTCCPKTGQMIGVLLLLGLVSSGLAAVISTTPLILTTMPNTCEHRGTYYKMGQHFSPTPCERCFCGTSGQAVCAYMDCALALCVDAVKQPDKCCSTCPNGWNCKHGDVTIKMGDVYHPDPATSCRCNNGPPHMGFGNLVLKAECTSV